MFSRADHCWQAKRLQEAKQDKVNELKEQVKEQTIAKEQREKEMYETMGCIALTFDSASQENRVAKVEAMVQKQTEMENKVHACLCCMFLLCLDKERVSTD